VDAVCSVLGLTCLEAALVRRAWREAQGQRCDIVLGVSAPSDEFRAHAWLDTDGADPRFVELGTLRTCGSTDRPA
jgi:hypothetical protein